MSRRLLIVDCCAQSNKALQFLFRLAKVDVRVVTNLADARRSVSWGMDAVLLERELPDGDGVLLLPSLLRQASPPSVALYTALAIPRIEIHPSVQYLRKPVPEWQLMEWFRSGGPACTSGACGRQGLMN